MTLKQGEEGDSKQASERRGSGATRLRGCFEGREGGERHMMARRGIKESCVR